MGTNTTEQSSFKFESIDLTNDEQSMLVDEILKASEQGDEYSKNKNFELLWRSITKLATKLLTRSYSYVIEAYPESYEEMMMEAAANVYKDLRLYDKNVAGFCAFVGPRILHAGHNYISQNINGRSDNYEEHAHKIKRCIQELKSKDLDYDAQLISTLTNIPISTVYTILEQENMINGLISKDSDEFMNENLKASEDSPLANSFKSPESSMEEKEEAERVRKALSSLDRTTARIIKLKIGFDKKPMGENDIASSLNMTLVEVKQRYSTGMRNLKRILSKDILFSDRIISQKANNFNRMIKFAPTLSQSDIDDAESFMALNKDIYAS